MSPYTQDRRIARIESPFGEEVLIHRVKGEEHLSSLFRFELGLYSENPDLAAEDIVGQAVGLGLELGREGETQQRWIHGIVSRFAFVSRQGEGFKYKAELVPWSWLLGLRADCRIFQEQNALDIAQAIWGELDQADFETSLQPPDHATRGYCVQYRESTLRFLDRLFEQEGWFYFFRHEEDRHVLVLTRGDSQSSDCPELESELRYGGLEDHEFDPHLMVTEWIHERVLHPGAIATADYNYEDPRTRLLTTATTSVSVGPNDSLELYDYPGEFVKLGEPDGPKLDYGDEWARLRMEEEEAAAPLVRGTGTCHLLAPGMRFSLSNHPREAENDTYLVTSVRHELEQPVEMAGASGVDQSSYENRFTCIPASVPFVPRRRTPKTLVRGPQTAVVVGEDGANPGDVRIDSQGRVKVRFHWDRNEEAGGETTCWIRSSQGWAGVGWGAQFHPRVGHEVVVSFLEGDPDRPLITGRVYNTVNEIPYPSSSQGGIRSRSTPGGSSDNFNEIRFEDKKDEEQLYVHAEKNHAVVVENDRDVTVGHDETESIGNDRNVEVKGNHAEVVGKDMKIDVGANLTETISVNYAETVGAAMELSVGGALAVTVGAAQSTEVAGNETLAVGKGRTADVGENETKKVGESRTLTVGKDLTEQIDGKQQTTVKDSLSVKAKKVQIEADDQISIKTGQAEITMKKSGDVTIKGKKIEVKGSGDVILKGKGVKGN